ncbi:MAG: hypothetical protein JWN86_2895 [Planctomycetota bacterium]|nr:hypothetical protein [Planctomycetota bacterium]
MTDVSTHRPLLVSTDGGAGPYIMLPVDQLPHVQTLLDENRIRYWVDEDAISLNGKPAITVINLGRMGDAQSVQRLLDGKP